MSVNKPTEKTWQKHGTVADRLEVCRLMNKYMDEWGDDFERAARRCIDYHDCDVTTVVHVKENWDSRTTEVNV